MNQVRVMRWGLGMFLVPFLLSGMGCGSDPGQGSSAPNGHSHSHSGSGVTGEPRVIQGKGPAVSIEVVEDPSGGRRVKLNTRYFQIKHTGQQVDTRGDTVAGHAHLYVDRKLVAMFYENEHRLPLLSPGRHVISVMLSNMNHRPFLVGGKLVRDTAVVTVSDTAGPS